MKPEYYGDKRDLIKWAVLYHIAEQFNCKIILQIAYYRDSRFGNVVLDGKEKEIPSEILEHFRNLQNVTKIKSDFKVDVFDELFKNRKEYLKSVKAKIAKHNQERLIVFLDPDTGLETEKPKMEHVLKTELCELWGDLKSGSFLVLYQHQFRNKNWKNIRRGQLSGYLDLVVERVKIAEGPDIANDVVFYYIQKV